MSGRGVRTVESNQGGTPRLTYAFDVSPSPPPAEVQQCGGRVELTEFETCEVAYRGAECGDCPFGSETPADLIPAGWAWGAASQCTVPDEYVFVGGTRLCYCHGNVATDAFGAHTNAGCHYGDDCVGDCRQFGNEYFRNFESAVHAGVQVSKTPVVFPRASTRIVSKTVPFLA
eukprot:SAG22_NODE_10762_length_517_cov_0.870813_1_plen_172_part_11